MAAVELGIKVGMEATADPAGATPVTFRSAWLKLSLLAHGISVTPSFEEWFSQTKGMVSRRNFYNSPGLSTKVVPPQEVRVGGPGGLVVAVNNYGASEWSLEVDPDGKPALVNGSGDRESVSMVEDLTAICESGEVARACNLYGGSALSFFSPRSCYFFADGAECLFCSLGSTSHENRDYAGRLKPADVKGAINAVLEHDAGRVNQVMIVGGNERNLDRGFLHHVELVRAALDALETAGHEEIQVHLVTMPPRDIGLIHEFSGVPNVHVGFNLEVWDQDVFARVAPGKARDYGRRQIMDALVRLRDTIGAYRAHSILIAGLEPSESTLEGAAQLASNGISPIINIYHSDRGSRLGIGGRPTYAELCVVARGLQGIHDRYPVLPYWNGCGRNSIDYEASIGLFRSLPWSFGM